MRRFACLNLACGLVFVVAAEAATVKGKVIDYATRAGVPGVFVTVRPATGAELPQAITNAQGEYEVPAVPVGLATVLYSGDGYLRDPTERKCTVSEPGQTIADVPLYKREPDAGYLDKIRARLEEYMRTDPAAAIRELADVTSLPLQFSAKATLAQNLLAPRGWWDRDKQFAKYKNVDVQKVVLLEAQLEAIKRQPDAPITLQSPLPEATKREVIKSATEATPIQERAQFERMVAMRLSQPGAERL